MFKIKTNFAPLTIEIGSEEDLKSLIFICRNSMSYEEREIRRIQESDTYSAASSLYNTLKSHVGDVKTIKI